MYVQTIVKLCDRYIVINFVSVKHLTPREWPLFS